jgi:hypothetical protein
MMMKVIKIKKYSRNRVADLYTIIPESYITNDDGSIDENAVEYYVEERCEEDLAGHSYGWRSEWEFVTGKDEINKIVTEEISKVEKRISGLSERVDNLKELLV